MATDDRERPFSVRPANGDRERIVQIAKDRGISLNSLFLQAVAAFDPSRSRVSKRLDDQAIVHLQSQFATVRDALQSAKASPGVLPEAVERCERELIEIRNYLMVAMGRTP